MLTTLGNTLYHVERVVRKNAEVPHTSNPNLVYLASFPKSGNTWLRFILSNTSMLLGSHDTEVDFHTLGRYTPEPRQNRTLNQSIITPHFPLFLKTHWPHVQAFSKWPRVLVTRHPADALHSFYIYLREERYKHLKASPSQFLRYWRHGASAWSNYHQTWLGNYDVIMKYEDLLKDPVLEVDKMLKQLNYDIPFNILEEAVQRSSKETMRRLRNDLGDPFAGNPNYQFVRKGIQGEGLKAFNQQDLIYIAQICEPVIARLSLGYEF